LGAAGCGRGFGSRAAARIVQRVQLAVVAEQLGEPTEVEQVLMGSRPMVERCREVVGVLGQVVVHEGSLVGGADHRLLQLHLDRAPSVPSSTM
jgi:hypothetical protein